MIAPTVAAYPVRILLRTPTVNSFPRFYGEYHQVFSSSGMSLKETESVFAVDQVDGVEVSRVQRCWL